MSWQIDDNELAAAGSFPGSIVPSASTLAIVQWLDDGIQSNRVWGDQILAGL